LRRVVRTRRITTADFGFILRQRSSLLGWKKIVTRFYPARNLLADICSHDADPGITVRSRIAFYALGKWDCSKAADELSDKPGSVSEGRTLGGDHPSRLAVAGELQRSTRRLGRAALERLRSGPASRTTF